MMSHHKRTTENMISAPTEAAPERSSIFGRIKSFYTGSRDNPSPDGACAPEKEKKSTSSRHYGFSKVNFREQSDFDSEQLYQLKNFSSKTLRSASPPREYPPTAEADQSKDDSTKPKTRERKSSDEFDT
jgi:hypothetical protein